MLLFDIETDGLIDDVSVVHCINVIDRSTNKRLAYNGGVYKDGTAAPREGTIEEGLAMLERTDALAGHNIINYDIPVLKKLYPSWAPSGRVVDTRVCAQVIWADVKEWDFAAIARGSLSPDFQRKGLVGKHGLESWGYRLGDYKGDFSPSDYENAETGKKHTWKTIGFTQEMDTYGRQDVEVNLTLLNKIEAKAYSVECLDLEHRVAHIIQQQIEHGFGFDMVAAGALVAKLQRRHAEIAGELGKLFEPWYAADVVKGSALFTPKGDNKKLGYTAGAQLSKVKLVVFNPASRDHISDRLMKLRGWKPSTFTDGGKPQVDETTLESLPYPEAKVLAESLMVEKRLGQIAEGREAWLKHAVKDVLGTYRIHGNVTTNGAVTGRMTHASPNIAQCPRVGTPYGEECRACFIASPGLVLVGCDAEGIELRMLAHYMARYDEGAYVLVVTEGKKENGTDVHTVNTRAARLNKRDSGKTFMYALIYGAGDYKLGAIAYDDFTDEQRDRFNAKYPGKKTRAGALKRLGASRREALMTNLPALGQLVEAVKAAVKARGFLVGLDGRKLHIRGEHSALNTLLQSGGAVVMKKALVLFEDGIAAPKRSTNVTVSYVANVHDEAQLETEEQHAEEIGKGFANAIRLAGEFYKLRCPLSGSYGVGLNWKETH